MELKRAEYLDGYRILIEFSNGEVRTVDLESSLTGPVFLPLKDNGADFAPEYLYEISVAG